MRFMATRHHHWLLPTVLTTLLLAGTAQAGTPAQIHDPHRLPGNTEFQKTIEARCTICHTRERVDAARGEGQDLDALLQQMIERGAILSEQDKSVLGTFWGSPMKQKEE